MHCSSTEVCRLVERLYIAGVGDHNFYIIESLDCRAVRGGQLCFHEYSATQSLDLHVPAD